MYAFQILDTYVMGRQVSQQFLTIGAVLFVMSMFFSPESRSGPRLYARLAFLAILALLLWKARSDEKKTTAAEDGSTMMKKKPLKAVSTTDSS